MSAISAPTPTYLVRSSAEDVIFTPINATPELRNFFLLTTKETYRYDKIKEKFLCVGISATLLMKKGDHTTELRAFRAKTIDLLLDKVTKVIKQKYLRN